MSEVELKDKYKAVAIKSRKYILIDNFLGGVAWGLGSVIGATIIVGILGLVIVNTKKVPLIGDIVKIVGEQIQSGISELKNK